MALTKDERRALEYARKGIKEQGREYICVLIEEACDRGICSEEESTRLRTHIAKLLYPKASLSGWHLFKNWNGRDRDQRRADRLAWIDWMLGKPLPGEAVKLEWREKSDECEEAEYCGRRFLLTWADWNSRYVVTEPDAAYHVIAELPMNRRDEVDAAIVAHVWPEA